MDIMLLKDIISFNETNQCFNRDTLISFKTIFEEEEEEEDSLLGLTTIIDATKFSLFLRLFCFHL